MPVVEATMAAAEEPQRGTRRTHEEASLPSDDALTKTLEPLLRRIIAEAVSKRIEDVEKKTEVHDARLDRLEAD
eukprot:10200395-Lingulodinium_polyedra.AAC.1